MHHATARSRFRVWALLSALALTVLGTKAADSAERAGRWNVHNGATTAPPAAAPAFRPQSWGAGFIHSPVNNPDIQIFPSANPQTEVSIAINPTNPLNMLVTSNTTPTTTGQGYYYTLNGGVTWNGSDSYPNGASNFGDPVSVFDGSGTAYDVTLRSPSGIGMSTSANGGATWAPIFDIDPLSSSNDDKEHAEAAKLPGPLQNSFVCAWTDFTPTRVVAVTSRDAFAARRTLDGNLGGDLGQGVNVQWGPNNECYVTWTVYAGGLLPGSGIGFTKSLDGGLTFDPATVVFPITGIRTSNGANPLFNNVRVNDFPWMAVDTSNGPNQGRIYITYPDRSTGDSDIYVRYSDNQGATWSAAIRVNPNSGDGLQQYFPAAACDAVTGAVSIVYYSHQNAAFSTVVQVANSVDGGNTWDAFDVSDVPFTPTALGGGFAGGYQGDYIGIAAVNGKAYPAWCDNRSGQYNNYVQEVVFADPTDPNAPTNLSAASDFTTPTSIQLGWTDPTTFVDGSPLTNFGIKVFRNGSFVTEVASGLQSFNDTGLTDGTLYTYDLQTRETLTDSLSIKVSISKYAGGDPFPGPPTNFSVTAGVTSFQLDWTNPTVQRDGTPLDDFGGLNVYRNGILLASLSRVPGDAGAADTYTDGSPVPGLNCYQVSALDNESPIHESTLTTSICVETPLNLPFIEDFPVVGPLDAGKWSEVSDAVVSSLAANPPSAPGAVEILGLETATTRPINLSAVGGTGYVLLYSKEQTGNSESPDAGDDLVLEFMNSNGTWDEVARHFGADGDEVAFTTHVIGLDSAVPSSGTFFHTQFRFRFRNTGTLAGFDAWFVDNINIDIPNCQPTMTVAPSSVDDQLVAGTPTGDADPITVTNSCAFNALSWSAAESPDVTWLTLGGAAGVIGGTGSQAFTANFNAVAMAPGVYTTDIVVSSNDPVNPTFTVSATLTVNVAPAISVAPTSLVFSIPFGNPAETQQFTISNTGGGPLDFTIGEAVSALSGFGKVTGAEIKDAKGNTLNRLAAPGEIVRTPNATKALFYASARNASEATVRDQRGLDASGKGDANRIDGSKPRPWKGMDDVGQDRHFVPQPYGQGGPDGAGYRWIDSDEAGGPPASFVDISGVGTDAGIVSDDTPTAGFAIGFPFSFYGTTFNSLNISPDGFVSFSSATGDFTNDPIPGAGPVNLLALNWDDLDTRTQGTIYTFQDVANDRFIVQWDNVPTRLTTNNNTFQLILNEDGRIEFNYQAVAAPANSATVGCQKDATVGLQVAFNQLYLHDNLSVVITQDASWLSETPTSGTVPPAGSVVIDVTADPTGLAIGTYRGNVLVNSNDPVTPSAGVHVTLDVTGVGAALPLCDNFDTGAVPDPAKWTNAGVALNAVGLNEPSAPNSANFNGPDMMTSIQLDATGISGAGYVLAYSYEQMGGGEDPDAGNDLIVEIRNSDGIWDEVARHLGADPAMTNYVLNLIGIDALTPSSGTYYYGTLQFRFRSTSDAASDDWFVDDVCLDLPSCQPTIAVTPAQACTTLVAGTATSDPIAVTVSNSCAFAVLTFNTNIIPAVSWASVAPTNGAISGSGATVLDVTYNSIGLLPGNYTADLHILSNDPANPDVTVGLCLTVTGAPNMVVTPDSICTTSYVGGPIRQETLTISNTGPVDLNWQLADTKGIPAAPGALGTLSAGQKALEYLAPNAAKLARFAEYANLPPVRIEPGTEQVMGEDGNVAKGFDVSTDRRSQLQPFGQGGPDGFGYRWIDSDQVGGPAFSWYEIEGLPGTVDTGINGDDQNLGPFALGFDFPYYGTNYNTMRVCSNGWLSPTATTTNFTNATIPTAAAPNNIICPFWDDLLPTPTRGKVFFKSEPANGRAIFEWKKVPRFSSPADTLTFQVILCKDGSIQYNYLRLNGTVNSATVGIENAAGTVGLLTVFNAAYLHNGLSVLIQADQPWLSAAPSSGTVAPGGSQNVTVSFDPTGVAVGMHRGWVRISGNDPAHPKALVPVCFEVTENPPSDVCVTCPPTLHEAVEAGTPKLLQFPFCNCGPTTDTYYWCVSDDLGWQPATCDSVVLAPGACYTASVLLAVPGSAALGDTNTVRFHVYPGQAPEQRQDCLVRVPVIPPVISVVMARFEAISTPEGVALNWETATETNHSHFDVFRSESQNGGFSKLNTQPVRGEGKSYSFTDGAAVDGASYWYRLEAVDRFGVRQLAGNVSVTVDARPKAFALAQNYPNPFMSHTAFRLDVPTPTDVSVRIFDATGRLVKTMANGLLNGGRYTYEWNGKDDSGNNVAAGFYFLRAESKDFTRTVRMMLVK